MFNIFNCCSRRINSMKSGNIIDKNDKDYNLSCFYFTNKENSENKKNILLSSVLMQISYYPLVYWNNYFEKYRCISKPRDRFKSLDCETNFQEVDLFSSIPTNREFYNKDDISHNNKMLYESLLGYDNNVFSKFNSTINSTNSSTNNHNKNTININTIPKNDSDSSLDNLIKYKYDDKLIPFSDISRNFIDNNINNKYIDTKPITIKINKNENYKFHINLFYSHSNQTIYIIPVIDIINDYLLNKIEKYSTKITDITFKNENFLKYILHDCVLSNYNFVIVSHLYSTFIGINIAIRLNSIYQNKIKFFSYHPVFDFNNQTKLWNNLFESDIKTYIFSCEEVSNLQYLFLKNIHWIPIKNMIEYYDYDCDCKCNNINDILCAKPHKINRKKNIRSYVHTLFTHIDTVDNEDFEI